jgi:ATP-dependent DNA helicase Rep
LPAEDLVWMSEKSKVDPEERQQRGKAHLSNIRDMLK